MKTLVPTLITLGLLASPAAFAQSSRGGIQVLAGPGYTFDDEGMDGRLSLRGELPLMGEEALELGFVVPVTLASSTATGIGFEAGRSLMEIAPSLRARILPYAVARPYADAGAGMVFSLGETLDPLQEGTMSNNGFLARGAVGIELGPSTEEGGFFFIVEPLNAQLYVINLEESLRLSSMLGVGALF